ncbi:MAG: UvrD-helicase domain-containing protein [Flavobacteriales bacterium]
MTDIVLLSDCPFMESTKKFIVLKASAGSGKTFTLVFHYLSCALRFENPSYYKHILAITFTNAAANEMKQRVLNTLKEISEGQGQSDMEKKLLESLKVSADVLKSRAQAAYSHMLHNYSKLSILTIDSFTHRSSLVCARSSAQQRLQHRDEAGKLAGENSRSHARIHRTGCTAYPILASLQQILARRRQGVESARRAD